MTNKIATLIFVVINTLVLSVSAFLITEDRMTGIGVAGMVLCTVSSWIFRIWHDTRTKTKEETV